MRGVQLDGAEMCKGPTFVLVWGGRRGGGDKIRSRDGVGLGVMSTFTLVLGRNAVDDSHCVHKNMHYSEGVILLCFFAV